MLKLKKMLVLLSLIFLLIPVFSFAQTTAELSTSNNVNSSTVSFPNPLGNVTLEQFMGRIIKAMLGLTGSIALAMFIYAGFLWLTAAGDKGKVSKGMEIMKWSTAGLVLMFSAYAVVRYILEGVARG